LNIARSLFGAPLIRQERALSKTLKTVGVVLGAAALIATGVGAVGGLGLLAATTATTIGTYAGIAAGIANIGSQALAKPPPARGSVSQVLIMPDAPRPYPMGEGHFAGVQRHREGYGGTVDGVENPYWLEVNVYSGVGPVQSITPQVDFAAVPAWFTGYLATDTQLGAMPEATALAASFGTPGRWTANHKLSGHAAIAWNYTFDKKGKKFASGLPLTGAYGQWNRVYDPRLDSTFPGGSGSHRIDDETTWEWSENPALHAGTYAYGRYAEGVKVMGIGLPVEGIDFAVIAAWANVCEANDWTIFGVAFEGGAGDQQGIRWANLKDICAAGGGEPCFAGAVLSFRYDAPAVALDTVTDVDVFGGQSVTFMQSWRDRLNTIVPKYRSPDHNWEIVAAESVQEASYVTEDGEVRREEWTFNFAKNEDQATQLAAYKLVNSRELHPIRFTGMPRLRNYRPGDCLHLTLPRLGLDTDAILLERGPLDPRTMTRELVFIGETASKHAYALGLTGTAPPTPALGQTAQERDETAAGAADRQVAIEVLSYKSFPADYTGAIAAELLPAVIAPLVTLGGQDIRTEDFVSYSISTSGVTASVNDTGGDPDKGTIEITAVDTLDGWIDLTVVVSGVTYPAKRIVVQKISGLVPGLGGTGSKIASDNSFVSISSTAFTVITDVLRVTLAGGESLYGTAPLSYWVDSGSPVSRTADGKWRYELVGSGTPGDFDTAITGTAATGGYASEAGYGEFTHAKSGLAAGDYDVWLEAKLNTSGVSVTFSGTAVIEAKV
jgi:hypothetical protein